MFRFIAFLWDSADQEHAERARRLSAKMLDLYGEDGNCHHFNGLSVHWKADHAPSSGHHLLCDEQGIVVGTLFKRADANSASPTPAPVLDAKATGKIVSSQGRDLIESYWGRYVAFVRGKAPDHILVVREPTNSLPCFVTTIDGIPVVFSYVEDCTRLGARFTVNWDFVLVQLATGANTRLSGTGLNEVTPIHGGECATFAPALMSRQFYWNPFAIAASDPFDDPTIAAAALGKTAKQCVHAWASRYESIALRLSGGVDSSILAACLSSAPTSPRVTCFNHYSIGPDSDERGYARLVAARAGSRLIERERDENTRLDQLSRWRPHPSPLHARYSIDYGAYETTLARENSATAIFSGEWGDALFHSTPSGTLAARDYAFENGIGIALLRIALDMARLEGNLFWRVLWNSVVPRRADGHSQGTALFRCLLAPAAAEAAANDTRFEHPWLKTDVRLPPGKICHVNDSTLVDLHPYYDPLGRAGDPDQVAPLHSQRCLSFV